MWVNEKKNILEKDAINAVFKYVEDNPAMGINVLNKLMVDSDETDVYLAVEQGNLTSFYLRYQQPMLSNKLGLGGLRAFLL